MTRVKFELPGDWEDPDGLHHLVALIRETRPSANISKIRLAYFVAEQAHAGQLRSSGQPYVTHPLAVAEILAELRMDDDTLCAAFLHDVLEDVPDVRGEDLGRVFGGQVLHLIDGVTKLKFKPQGELTAREKAVAETTRTAETLRKMLLAMAKDFRVMVIKLADRLHNLQTLGALAEEKRIRIARETLDVYAPLAARLGIWQLKWQLEDLAFKHLHPSEFQRVSDLVSKSRVEREAELADSIRVIKEKLQARGVVSIEIRGRPKHLYSIFNKMVKQGVQFEEIYDLLALRIIVPEVSDCYVTLGIVHEMFTPIMQLFYDYIARPKTNGYQSLHTKVLGPTGQPLEIQIRTVKMHEIAEFGVAAHWSYKEGINAGDESVKLKDLREQLFDWSSESKLSSDFLRSVSTDLFAEQVFVFTPKGDVLDLPIGSTPVDFAFRVHTRLGMTLVGAKINGHIAPLSTQLQNGDVVEIVNRSNAQPSLDWLEFVKSQHARSKIRAHFRKLNRESDSHRGRELLEKELKSLGLDHKQFLGEDKLSKLLEHYNSVESPTELLAKVGSGLVSVQSVIQRLRGIAPDQQTPNRVEVSKSREGKLELRGSGMDGILVARAKCCGPIPGDEVVGYVTRARGISLHRKVCPNAIAYLSSEPERLMPFAWTGDSNVYGVSLRIIAVDRTGLLAEIVNILSESKTNLSSGKIKTLPNSTAEIDVTIDVRDTDHLQQVMTKIGNFSDVISILRVLGKG